MYPVLRTKRLDEAYALARDLISHAVTVQEVDALAVTGVDGLHRYEPLRALAEVKFHTSLEVPESQAEEVLQRLEGHVNEDQVHRFDWGEYCVWDLDPAAAAPLSGVDGLIVRVDADEAPDLLMEQPFLHAVAETDVAQLYWSVVWPEVPERDLRPIPKYDGVEILVHTPSLFSEVWCDTHSVWVHCRSDERAHWAAERVGKTVLGQARGGR